MTHICWPLSVPIHWSKMYAISKLQMPSCRSTIDKQSLRLLYPLIVDIEGGASEQVYLSSLASKTVTHRVLIDSELDKSYTIWNPVPLKVEKTGMSCSGKCLGGLFRAVMLDLWTGKVLQVGLHNDRNTPTNVEMLLAPICILAVCLIQSAWFWQVFQPCVMIIRCDPSLEMCLALSEHIYSFFCWLYFIFYSWSLIFEMQSF